MPLFIQTFGGMRRASPGQLGLYFVLMILSIMLLIIQAYPYCIYLGMLARRAAKRAAVNWRREDTGNQSLFYVLTKGLPGSSLRSTILDSAMSTMSTDSISV